MELFEGGEDDEEEPSSNSSAGGSDRAERRCGPLEAVFPATVGAAAYVGPVVVSERRGAGRGVFARRALEAGCLVLAEAPLVRCAKGVEAAGARAAKRRPDVAAAVEALHPIELADASAAAVTKAERACGDRRDARLWLAMRFNAFDSGVFARLSLFNHACGFSANCVRLDAASGFGIADDLTRVFVCRRVEAGDELLLGYEQPCESATEPRRRRLLERFDFRCDCPTCRRAHPDETRVEADILETRGEPWDPRVDDAVARLGDPAAPLVVRARRLAFNAALAALAALSHEPDPDRADLARLADLALRRGRRFLDAQTDALGPDHVDLAPTARALADVLALALARRLPIPDAAADQAAAEISRLRARADALRRLYRLCC